MALPQNDRFRTTAWLPSLRDICEMQCRCSSRHPRLCDTLQMCVSQKSSQAWQLGQNFKFLQCPSDGYYIWVRVQLHRPGGVHSRPISISFSPSEAAPWALPRHTRHTGRMPKCINVQAPIWRYCMQVRHALEGCGS